MAQPNSKDAQIISSMHARTCMHGRHRIGFRHPRIRSFRDLSPLCLTTLPTIVIPLTLFTTFLFLELVIITVGDGNAPFNTSSLRGTHTPLHVHFLSGISSRTRRVGLITRFRHIIPLVWHLPMSCQQALVVMLCARTHLHFSLFENTVSLHIRHAFTLWKMLWMKTFQCKMYFYFATAILEIFSF